MKEQPWFQQGCFLILWVFCCCPVWAPFRARTEGWFEEDVNVGPLHGRGYSSLLILCLEAPRSARSGFDLIRLILWHYLDCADRFMLFFSGAIKPGCNPSGARYYFMDVYDSSEVTYKAWLRFVVGGRDCISYIYIYICQEASVQ